MGWMCVQTPFPVKEQPETAEDGTDDETEKDN